MKRLLALTLSVLLIAALAHAQTATVTRNVYLHPEPSSVSERITKLTPPHELQVLDLNPTNGFYHVATAEGDEGWVWGKNIHIEQVPPAQPGAATTEISSAWDKPEPQTSAFQSDEGPCGETGEGGDADTNRRKNRTDVPTAYHLVTWDAINNLNYPEGAPRSRANWTQEQLGVISPFEGVAITVVGYLYKIKVEKSSVNARSGGESTNCHAHLASDVDWHMPLTASARVPEDVAIIVETTPRVRRDHPNWTTERLKPWTFKLTSTNTNSNYNGQAIRVSGWLILDPEHQDMINSGLRSTLWEIHPITKIEVFSNGGWVDLDTLP